MTNTINNSSTNGLLNGGHRTNPHSLSNPGATSAVNANRHHFRNSSSSANSITPDNFSALLFEPPVSILNYNSSGSLSSSSTSSSSSSNSSSSYWPSLNSQMTDDPQSETTAERLEQNSHKFHKTPYRDDNCKNEWLSAKAREILGPTNMLRSSSPNSNLPPGSFNEPANANLLNPKSPTNSLTNRSNNRQLPKHNTQSASNLNSLSNNNAQLGSQNSAQQSSQSRNSTNNNNNNNSQNINNTNKFNQTSTNSNTNKNTSPPVISSHKVTKPMHHSASLSALPVHKQHPPRTKADQFNEIFKVFKQMQLKPFISRLDDNIQPVNNTFSTGSNGTEVPEPGEIVRTKTPIGANSLKPPGPLNLASTKTTTTSLSFDLTLSEDDGDDSFSHPAERAPSKQPTRVPNFDKPESRHKLNNLTQQQTALTNEKALTNSSAANLNKYPQTANSKPINANVKPTSFKASTSRTPTPTITSLKPNENQLITENETDKTNSIKPVMNPKLEDSMSSSSSDDEDSDSSSSSSSSSNGSSSSSDSDDDSSSSSSSSSSEGECSSSSNESDAEKSTKKVKQSTKKLEQPLSASKNVSNGLKVVGNVLSNPHHHHHGHHHRREAGAKVNDQMKANNFNKAKTELDKTTLVQKLSTHKRESLEKPPVTTATTTTITAKPKQTQQTEINLNKEDLSFNLSLNEKSSDLSKKTLDELSDTDDDPQNMTITGMIEKIVSPNKKTNSSSSSSSKNTSPQLPIFSSTASESAQLVPSNNTRNTPYTHIEPHKQLSTVQQQADSTNPSPYMDNDFNKEDDNDKVTFTLSDDEIGEDSNASNYNMQNVLSCQRAVSVPNVPVINEVQVEKTPVAKDDASSCFQSFNKSMNTFNYMKNSETLFKKQPLPFSSENQMDVCDNKSTANSNKGLIGNTETKRNGDAKVMNGEDLKKETIGNTKLAVTGDNFKQPKPDFLAMKNNGNASNSPLSAGFTPSKTFQNELKSPSLSPTRTIKQTSPAPSTIKSAVASPSTTKPADTSPSTTKSAVTLPSTTKPAVTSPSTTKPSVISPSTTKPAITSPSNIKQAVLSPSNIKSAVTSPPYIKPTVTSPPYIKSAVTSPPNIKSAVTSPPNTKPSISPGKQQPISPTKPKPTETTTITDTTSKTSCKQMKPESSSKHYRNSEKKQPKSKRLIEMSSSSDDEESNDDEFKDELGQYLKKKRPIDSSDESFRETESVKKSTSKSGTPNPTKTSTPSIQNRASSNNLVTPTTAPSTPALIETNPPNPTQNGKVKSQQVQKLQNNLNRGGSPLGGNETLSGKIKKTNITNKMDEYDTSNELINNGTSDKKMDDDLWMLNKQNKMLDRTTPNHLKKEEAQYGQLMNPQIVNHTAILNKNGNKHNDSQFQKQPQDTNSSSSIAGDQIQYTADGRPKLIVSIELDLIKILNTQFGMQPLNDQYLDQADHITEMDSLSASDEPKKLKKTSNHVINSPSKNSTVIPNNKRRDNMDSLNKAQSSVPSPVPSSDTDDPTKDRKRDQQLKTKSVESRKSMHETSKSDAKQSKNNDPNSSLSLKRSGEDFENSQRTATKKQRLKEDAIKSESKTASVARSPSVNSVDTNTLKMRNKTTSFSNVNMAKSGLVTGKSEMPAGLDRQNPKSKSSSNMLASAGDEKKKAADKYGLFSLDFSSLEEQELHRRGKQKKHEADQEKDKFKKSIAYMEAVCYFCLCAISQYRLKKAAVNPSSNKSSFDLLNDTYQLLKYLQEKVLKSIDNDTFIKKFKVLSSWMETFINRWLWLMSLNEIRKLKESIAKQTIALAAHHATANGNSHTSKSENNKTALTSPNELPPPSPASSIGSSAGSLTGQSNGQTSGDSAAHQQMQFEIMQKTMSMYERQSRLNEYNFRSQNFWDSNELQINEVEYLNEFRETIKKQVQKELHIDCEAELFASYIITGLQLFKLNF